MPSRLTPVNVEGPEDDPIAFEDAVEGAARGLRPGDDSHVGSDGQGPDVLGGLAGHCGGESQRAWLGRYRTTRMCRQDPAALPKEPWVTQVGGPPDSIESREFGLVAGKGNQSPSLKIWVNRGLSSLVPGLWLACS